MKRHPPLFLGLLATSILIIIGALLVGLLARRTTVSPSTNSVEVMPIFSEEINFSKKPAGTIARSDPALTLLEDSGEAIAKAHTKAVPRDPGFQIEVGAGDPYAKLRSTTSSFVGIGLEGSSMVNGKPFSWANVNLSNISYG